MHVFKDTYLVNVISYSQTEFTMLLLKRLSIQELLGTMEDSRLEDSRAKLQQKKINKFLPVNFLSFFYL